MFVKINKDKVRKTICNECKEVGHASPNCPYDPCTICGSQGHWNIVCPQAVCIACKENGHKSSMCKNTDPAILRYYNTGFFLEQRHSNAEIFGPTNVSKILTPPNTPDDMVLKAKVIDIIMAPDVPVAQTVSSYVDSHGCTHFIYHESVCV